MTKKITCPCCGSENIKPHSHAFHYRCLDCPTFWDEEQRKPPTITPEMAWDWFCKQMFECDADIEKISVDKHNLISADYYYHVDNPCVRWHVFSQKMTKILGWQSMPERVRRVCDEK